MRKIIIKLILFPILLSSCQTRSESDNLLSNQVQTPVVKSRPLIHKIYELSTATVHTLLIPNQSNFTIDVAVSNTLKTLEDYAQKTEAVAVLNGGFFDPVNSQTTSYVTKEGKVMADPSNNPRLMDNPQLQPYLNKYQGKSFYGKKSTNGNVIKRPIKSVLLLFKTVP